MDSSKLITSIVTAARSYGKLTAFIKEAIALPDKGRVVLQDSIAKFKDTEQDKAARKVVENTYRRELAKLNLKPSIKDGIVTVATMEPKAKPEKGKAEPESGAAGETGASIGGTPADPVAAALAIVLANLDNPAILMALKEGLAKREPGF